MFVFLLLQIVISIDTFCIFYDKMQLINGTY